MNARSSRSHTVFQLAISAARAALVPGGKVARPYVCVCVPVVKVDYVLILVPGGKVRALHGSLKVHQIVHGYVYG